MFIIQEISLSVNTKQLNNSKWREHYIAQIVTALSQAGKKEARKKLFQCDSGYHLTHFWQLV